MDQWEYMICMMNGTTVTLRTSLPIEPYVTAFPEEKVTRDGQGDIIIELKNELKRRPKERTAFENSVLEYLGTQGWEAYHVVVPPHNYYLKRKK